MFLEQRSSISQDFPSRVRDLLNITILAELFLRQLQGVWFSNWVKCNSRDGQAMYWSLPVWSTVNLGENSHVPGLMKALVLLKTQLDLKSLLLVSYTGIRPCCCHMLASSKHLYCTRNCVCVLYNKNPLSPLPLSPRFSLSQVSFRGFSLTVLWTVHPWYCWTLLCPTQSPLAQCWDFQKLPSDSFNCIFSKNALTKLLDLSFSMEWSPESYLTSLQISAIHETIPGKDK